MSQSFDSLFRYLRPFAPEIERLVPSAPPRYKEKIVTKWLFFTIASCDAAEPSSQDAATPVMQGIIDLHHDIFFFLILILVFVLWVLVRALWHFHYRRNPIPQRIVHGTTIEIIWTIFPSIILMFIAIPSFALFYFDVALCQPPVEEGPEVSSGGSLGALMRSPEAPSLDWDELLQGRSLNPDQGTGRVGSHTPGDTVSGSAVDGGAAPASASTPPNEYLLTFLRWPLDAGSYYSYLSWAHLFPEHVQPCHWGAAPWLLEY